MAKLPENVVDPIAEAVYQWYEAKYPPANREHLGASEIGEDCDALLWYRFRWCYVAAFEGRILRLFRRGWAEEAKIEEELRGIGVEVSPRDPATGRQWRRVAHGGHFGQGADGMLGNVPGGGAQVHLAEYKTYNRKRFDALRAQGVERSDPKYAAQCQVGMRLHGLKRTLFVASCKDDDRIHTERLKLDEDVADRLLARAGRIIFAPTRPARISDDPAHFRCARFCDAWGVCHGREVPSVNCRTCAHSSPTDDELEPGVGTWRCARYDGAPIPEYVQRVGCTAHAYLPELVPLEAVDSDGETVEYEGGLKNGPGGLASAEFRDTLNAK